MSELTPQIIQTTMIDLNLYKFMQFMLKFVQKQQQIIQNPQLKPNGIDNNEQWCSLYIVNQKTSYHCFMIEINDGCQLN